jgi:outer membrane protein insertion porin family
MHRRRTTQLLALLTLATALTTLPLALAPAAAQQGPLIVSVTVAGNQYISRDAVLYAVKDILKIGEVYSDQKATAAHDAVMRMGYFADAEVSTQAVAQGVTVLITVVERERLNKIVFVGNTVFTDAQLLSLMRVRVGDMVDNDAIRRDTLRLSDHYEQAGYLVLVSQARVDDHGVLSIVLEERRIERFKIEGLKKTKEWVVRRMIQTRPGGLFRQAQIQQDLRRIYDVGIFQSIKTDVRNGEVDPTAVIVVVELEEKRTGTASVAAAYSDLDHFVLMLSVGENNFRGRAEKISTDIETFGRQSYDLNYFEPFLDKKNTSMDLSLFDTERNRRFVGGTGIPLSSDQFQEKRIGGSVTFTRPLTPTQRVSLGFRTEEVTSSYLNAEHDIGPPGQVGPQQTGGLGPFPINPFQPPGPGDLPGDIVVLAPLHPPGRVNSTTVGYTWDTRDSSTDTKRGNYTNLSVQVAGAILGGASTYNMYSGEEREFFAVRRNKDVIALRLMVGTSTGNLPLFDSFSVGGATTLRGYQEDRWRGANMVLGNVEYRFRMTESLVAVLFVDAGDAYGGTFPTIIPGFNIPADDQTLSLHVGTGVGMRAVTPLGPIRVDWGFGSEGSQIEFGFGNIF